MVYSDLLFQASSTNFEEAGIEVTNERKEEVDRVIHGIVGVEYKHCPSVWGEIKRKMVENGEGFASELKEALSEYVSHIER